MTLRRVILVVVALLLIAAGFFIYQIGPRNIIGMLMYDQRKEVELKAGDAMPDVVLEKLTGGDARLRDFISEKPLVIIFGSFT